MSRHHPYITKQPEGWQQFITELNTKVRLFLVSTVGPTVFILKADNQTEMTFKVFIGERQMCSCGGGEGRGKLCFHIGFVMIKVLRVSPDNPVSWQLSLIDSEVDSILSGEVCSKNNVKKRNPPHSFLRKGHGRLRQQRRESTKRGENDDENTDTKENKLPNCVARRELNENDTSICCICQDEMTVEDFEAGALCFCESQCGTNYHIRCFRMYAGYNRSEKKAIVW